MATSRPNISELERLLNTEDDLSVEILPNGDVRKLAAHEVTEKRLRIALESNEVLRNEIQRLQSRLKEIVKLAGRE